MRRSLVVAVLALWALIGLPGAAHAGGPTSVLITQPATGQAAALYYSSEEYADLERLLTADPTTTTGLPAGPAGGDYTVTWMIHDVMPWRVDTVRVTGDGTAHVTTRLVSDSEQLGAEDTQSKGRVVAEGDELVALLDRVLAKSASRAAPQPVADREPTVAPAVPPEPATDRLSLTGWRWAVPGLLGGVLVGLVAARRRLPGEPRRALLDREPEQAGV